MLKAVGWAGYRVFWLTVTVWTIGTVQLTDSAGIPLLESDHEFSYGDLDYRNLVVDSTAGTLYASGKNHLFRLWIYNVNDTSEPNLFSHRELPIEPADRMECERFAGAEQCQNEVRVLLRRGKERSLFVCSSNGLKPQVRLLDATTLADRRPPENQIGVCSSDGSLNTTAIFVEWGNPDDIPSIYSGIRTGLTLENHLIYRPPLMKDGREWYTSMRTMYTDSKWLNEPQFVASFDIGDYVYFFFRELSLEHSNCGRSVYSRVARLCKKDLGGKNVLRQVWTSYVKARLNCSIPSDDMVFYFDHIQAVYGIEVPGSSTWHFYAILTTVEAPFPVSAICVFRLDDVNLVFASGNYLEQSAPNAAWLPFMPEQQPVHRPGSCSVDSRSVSDTDLHFVKSHLLMADPIPSSPGGGPLAIVREEILTSIVVDTVADGIRVVFAVSRSSKLYKLVHWDTGSKLLGIYRFPWSKTEITALTLLPGEYLFAAGRSRIGQFHVTTVCPQHRGCLQCASDPYCSWNSTQLACSRRETAHSTAVGWIAPRTQDAATSCGTKVPTVEKLLYPGDGVLLECGSTGLDDTVEWKNNGRTIENPIRMVGGGLVLMNVTVVNSGKYECFYDGALQIQYAITIDEANCSRPTSLRQFQSVYREWCKKYDSYKMSLSKWQTWYEQNAQCMSLPKQLKLKTDQISASFDDINQIELL